MDVTVIRANKVRSMLLRSMMLTFPISAYLWATGVVLTGILYIIDPRVAQPADIPFVPDLLWGLLLTTIGVSMLYAMVKEKGRAINVLSFLTSVFATTLFIASGIEHRPVSMISSGLTATYYAYSYLCAHLISEWRQIDRERTERLKDHLRL